MSDFEKSIKDYGLVFGLTCSERERLDGAKFMQKRDILDAVGKMKPTRIFSVKNIIHFNGEFHKEETSYIMPKEVDRFAADMMDMSISYAILWVDCDILGFNSIAVARTAHHTTNIDADVIGALIDRMGKGQNDDSC